MLKIPISKKEIEVFCLMSQDIAFKFCILIAFFFNEVADVLCIELNFVLIEETLKVEFD